MKPTQLTSDIQARLGIKAVLIYGFAASLTCNVLLAAAFAAKSDTHRTTIVPPNITKSFWVEDNAVSPEYLEQMGSYVLNLALTNTPSSAEYNARQLLKVVAPASYGTLERTLLAGAREMKENSATTVWSPSTATPHVDKNAIVYSGVRTTWIGDKRTSQEQKTYLVRFSYSGGKILLRELVEVSPKDPLKETADDTK